MGATTSSITQSLTTTTTTTSSSSSTTTTVQSVVFKSLGNLISFLPTGTVFLFRFFNPILTDNGTCNTMRKSLTSVFLAICGLSCFLSTFTDSYVGTSGGTHYGLVTPTGLWTPGSSSTASASLSSYKLRAGDFLHAILSCVVFAVVGLLDINTVRCLYPSLEQNAENVVKTVPIAVGAAAGAVAAVLPWYRHGIGYPASTSTSTQSSST